MGNELSGKDILSVRQFNREQLAFLFALAEEMRLLVSRFGTSDLLKGKFLANLFYEPSTRTAASFMTAMLRLGGNVLPIHEINSSSVVKGESLADTVRILEQYCDLIVLRHPQVGAAQAAADAASKPVINAGDGVGEHPTQALLDLYTIEKELGKIDGLSVVMIGDMKNGRTVHSLSRLLSLFKVRLTFVSPLSLSMPGEVMEELRLKKVPVTEKEALDGVIKKADILYVTRVQKERFIDQKLYEKVKDYYVVTPKLLRQAKKKMRVMHPLPRVMEIVPEVDKDPRAAYFRQAGNGLFLRMALLAAVLGRA